MVRRALLIAFLLILGLVGVGQAGLTLTHLSGTWQADEGAVIEWGTQNELTVAGFDVYRSSQPLAPAAVLTEATRLTPSPIVSEGACVSVSGEDYRFVDESVLQDTEPSYYYWLAVHECSGTSISLAQDIPITITRPISHTTYLPLVIH